MKRNELDAYLRKLLNADTIEDESINGLQVEGKEEIQKIGFSVSSSEDCFKKAGKSNCDALVVHHGILWKNNGVEPITGTLKKRLSFLLKKEINLFAFHLPLDCHPQLGNNARAAIDLGLGNIKPFCKYRNSLIGFMGNLLTPLSIKECIKKFEEYYCHKGLLLPFGKKEIKSIGIVSGGAAEEVFYAKKESLDLYITGEPKESVFYLAKELEINVAFFGHYATEKVGIKALKEHIETILKVETEFIDSKNPL